MTLTELIAELNQKGSSGINTVITDLQEEINLSAKTYPVVFWDLNSFESTENFASGEQDIEINCFVVDSYDKGSKTETRTMAQVWDGMHTKFKAYIENLNSRNYLLCDDREVTKEFYDFGMLSIDAEIGIGYKFPSIKIFC